MQPDVEAHGTFKRWVCRALAAASVAAVGLVGAAAPAHADTVGCGSVVTSSVVLTSDLSCTGAGLVVGASNITIDLNGHTLTGTATGSHFGPAGLSFTPLAGGGLPTSVTVRNGTIQGFDAGINGSGGSATTYRRLSLVGNGTGLLYGNSAPSPDMLRNSLISGNGVGIELGAFNGPPRLLAIGDEIASNTVGVTSSQVNGSTLMLNDIHDNATGVRLFESDAWVVDRNSIHDNDLGLVLTDSSATVVSRNDVSRNRVGVSFDINQSSSTPSTVSDNEFKSNGAAGVLAQAGPGTVPGVISGNTFARNGFAPAGTTDANGQLVDDGLHVNAAGGSTAAVTVADNKAHRNADYGIEAPGVQDGGHNHASANGNPAQCTGVICRAKGGNP